MLVQKKLNFTSLSIFILIILIIALTNNNIIAQSISTSRINQISHHTDERISSLKGDVQQILQVCNSNSRCNGGNYLLIYNKLNQLEKVEERMRDNQRCYRIIKYEYDSIGRRTEGNAFDCNNSFLVNWSYKYDLKTIPLELYYDNQLYETYNYDSNDVLIKIEKLNYNTTLTKSVEEYSYNNKGQIEKIKVSLDSHFFCFYSYEYYENGEVKYFKKSSNRIINEYYFKYEYDDKGNWISRKVDLFLKAKKNPNEQKRIASYEYTRTITYFN